MVFRELPPLTDMICPIVYSLCPYSDSAPCDSFPSRIPRRHVYPERLAFVSKGWKHDLTKNDIVSDKSDTCLSQHSLEFFLRNVVPDRYFD